MTVFNALVISICVGILTVLNFTASGGFKTAIMTGVVTGLVLGHPEVGLQVGATCQLMSMGFFPYGGAVTPNYPMGAIFGTVIAIMSGDYNQGIVIGSVIALLGSWFTIAKGFINVRLIHAEDKALENGNYKAINFYHILGIVITALVTMSIPVFFGLMIIDRYEIVMNFINNYAWIKSGLAAVSNLLAAVGFALLLSYMDIKDYWPFMLIGYALFAFFGASTMAIAIVAISVGYIYVFKLKKEEKGGAK